MPTVAYLGPPASFSHQVTLQTFPSGDFTLLPSVTIADVFRAVQNGQTDYGVVPVENSTNGSVVITLDLLCDREHEFPDLRIISDEYLKIHMCLLGHEREEISPDTVSKIYSHPQAFGQCDKFLTEHLKGVRQVDTTSTSKAAELAASEPSAVAIASKFAKQDHESLKILRENIEDKRDNTTRFFVISAKEATEASTAIDYKTFLCFITKHKQPGSLCDALKVFKDYKMDLTSLSSRPTQGVPWNYIFLVEYEGHADSENAKLALEEMRKYCISLRVLGSYQNNRENA